jgi:Protein of unknown function (DUF1176)
VFEHAVFHAVVTATAQTCRSAIGGFDMLTRTSTPEPRMIRLTQRSRFLHAALLLALAAPMTFPVRAVDAAFQHEDWELVCDNTRTCRVAGYQRDDSEMPVSVLLTRKAGPATAVVGRVRLGDGWQDSMLDGLPAKFPATLWIDGTSYGAHTVEQTTLEVDLTAAQVAALLKALARDSRIEFRAGKTVWALSDSGAAAVLLKMDEFQGRIGTVGAAFRKGKQPETKVLPPLPAPVVKAAPLAPAKVGDARFIAQHGDALRKALRSVTDEDSCSDLHRTGEDTGDEAPTLDVVRLTKTKLLVSTRCWLAAYNAGSGYWIINDTAPYRPELVTADATDFDKGTLGSSQKARGIGDCWGSEQWTWNGTAFVQTSASSTGMCKGFAGGAWELPTLVTDIR